jgi:hypothetical protein
VVVAKYYGFEGSAGVPRGFEGEGRKEERQKLKNKNIAEIHAQHYF